MRNQNCENCEMKLSYKSRLKAVFNKGLNCTNCGAHYETTLVSRAVLMVLILLPSFVSIWSESLREYIRNLPSLLILVYVALIIAISPFIFRYKLSENN